MAPPQLLDREVHVDAVGEDPPGLERRLHVDALTGPLRGGAREHAGHGEHEVLGLQDAACDELRVWLAAQKEYRLAQGPAWNEVGRVVPKKDGTQMAPSTLKSQWWNWVARQRIDPHLPIHGLRDSFGTWVYETYGVKQAQEWLGHSDPATTLRHYVRLTAAARAKAVEGLDEVTRAALVAAEAQRAEDAAPAPDNVVSLAGRRR